MGPNSGPRRSPWHDARACGPNAYSPWVNHAKLIAIVADGGLRPHCLSCRVFIVETTPTRQVRSPIRIKVNQTARDGGVDRLVLHAVHEVLECVITTEPAESRSQSTG
jgi:hypothetical protein